MENITTQKKKVHHLFQTPIDGGILVTTTLDMRYNGAEKIPIAVRVNFRRERYYYATEARVTSDEYEKLLASSGTKGDTARLKVRLQEIHNKVTNLCEEIKDEFTLADLKKALKPKVSVKKEDSLFQLWMQFADTKNTIKTRQQYISACYSFFKSRGCHTERVIDEKGELTRRMTLVGKALTMKPGDFDKDSLDEWQKYMEGQGNSVAARSVYLRAARALMIHLQEEGIIKQRPKIKVEEGSRRQDDFCKVPDIIRIMNYEGQYQKAADWWSIIYLCNGLNAKDLSELRYRDEDKRNNELSFVRSKTRAKNKFRIYIPIIPALQKLMDKYAAPYQDGALVFPQILGIAESEYAKDNRVHDFCSDVREGMSEVCKQLEITPVTVSTARNSYVTTLTWHQISDAFIDAATGHCGQNKVLRGYQGGITPKMRAKVNNLLLIDPEEQDG